MIKRGNRQANKGTDNGTDYSTRIQTSKQGYMILRKIYKLSIETKTQKIRRTTTDKVYFYIRFCTLRLDDPMAENHILKAAWVC